MSTPYIGEYTKEADISRKKSKQEGARRELEKKYLEKYEEIKIPLVSYVKANYNSYVVKFSFISEVRCFFKTIYPNCYINALEYKKQTDRIILVARVLNDSKVVLHFLLKDIKSGITRDPVNACLKNEKVYYIKEYTSVLTRCELSNFLTYEKRALLFNLKDESVTEMLDKYADFEDVI